ncbi:hypothetical protein HOLleu_23637 [Holothuria leucospilota]|uniref:Uncharacterized protein n=1 Tax=Holothuria leucospilota TaxID=206669 RepID=A0A9Q1H5T3_HOLLE|nr:hypothetical protein HOLleu_23637 [Holothuria leucospilota]
MSDFCHHVVRSWHLCINYLSEVLCGTGQPLKKEHFSNQGNCCRHLMYLFSMILINHYLCHVISYHIVLGLSYHIRWRRDKNIQ